MIINKRYQQTLLSPVKFSGIGLHTGATVNMLFTPAPANTGIIFRRTDLPGSPAVPAKVEYVQATPRCTVIGIGNTSIYTVEHILAALNSYNIDNLYIDLNAPEPPAADGSAIKFVEMIESVGIKTQDILKTQKTLKAPCYYSNDKTHIIALPYEGYKISYTLHYPDSELIGSQYLSLDIDSTNFKKELSTCRTFAKHEEVQALKEQGLIKGGSLDNAVVAQGNKVLNPEGLRFSDEMVRHKTLDLIGDLSLIGIDFKAHIISICSGHAANTAFAKELSKNLIVEE